MPVASLGLLSVLNAAIPTQKCSPFPAACCPNGSSKSGILPSSIIFERIDMILKQRLFRNELANLKIPLMANRDQNSIVHQTEHCHVFR